MQESGWENSKHRWIQCPGHRPYSPYGYRAAWSRVGSRLAGRSRQGEPGPAPSRKADQFAAGFSYEPEGTAGVSRRRGETFIISKWLRSCNHLFLDLGRAGGQRRGREEARQVSASPCLQRDPAPGGVTATLHPDLTNTYTYREIYI